MPKEEVEKLANNRKITSNKQTSRRKGIIFKFMHNLIFLLLLWVVCAGCIRYTYISLAFNYYCFCRPHVRNCGHYMLCCCSAGRTIQLRTGCGLWTAMCLSMSVCLVFRRQPYSCTENENSTFL